MPLNAIPTQTIANRAATVYRVNVGMMAVLYLVYGLNFLLFSQRTSIVTDGGLLGSTVFWGVAFIVVAALLVQNLIRPDVRWLYQISQIGLISLTVAWLIVRIVLVTQSGQDVTGPIFWIVLLVSDMARLYLTQDLRLPWLIRDVPHFEEVMARLRSPQSEELPQTDEPMQTDEAPHG